MKLEEMASFFDARVDMYEGHMMEAVDGARCFYKETAKLFPEEGPLRVLDLGCGTGLELDELFRRNPGVEVTGVDLSEKMLDRLKEKHKNQKLHCIRGSYFDVEFPAGSFDAALSVETLHHFTHEEKIGLYKKIWTWLTPDGWYVETDYMAPNQEYEDACFAEYDRLRLEQNVGEGFYHFDRPCTVENQLSMMEAAGFKQMCVCWRHEGTCMILAKK